MCVPYPVQFDGGRTGMLEGSSEPESYWLAGGTEKSSGGTRQGPGVSAQYVQVCRPSSTDTSSCHVCNCGHINMWYIVHRNLSVLRENFDHTCRISRKPDLASTNILDLAASTNHLSDTLCHTLLGGSSGQTRVEPDFTGLDMSTCAEKTAEGVSRAISL